MCWCLSKVCNPSDFESEIYDFWIKNNFFKADADSKKKKFSIVMPPPNITGNLHMGHALDCTLQDILIRYKRMCGYEVLWLPGTDHAAISTEVKVVEKLKSQNITKKEIGREEFLHHAWEWKKIYGNNICNQIRKLGCSCDWSRERFTLDEGCSAAVRRFFVSLYNKGLIYKGKRIINWCTNCQSSLSDIEVDFKESDSELVYIKYFLDDKSDFITVATTRPETIFGDSAVAVNPDDDRYKKFIGRNVIVPLVERKIKVISDNYVDKSFGTGALKVTPAHDFADFDIGERHNLEPISIIDQKGFLFNCIKYSGLERFKARKIIIDDLIAKNLLVKKEKIKNNIGTCYRCKNIIEPLISDQWFVKMKSLAAPAIDAVTGGDILFVPERFSKIYINWMTNIKDWCISRQIWWGHRIPAYYCQDCGYVTVSENDVSQCEKCKSKNINQDEDTLDTWFSSALWPFSTMGWPSDTKDLYEFYPTDVLVTGYDIIFFWVARMIFSSLELTSKIPFKKILIHGLVRDAKGRKMSKSFGNGIDPLQIISKYGTDALRLSLISGLTLGNDTRFLEEKIEGMRNLVNKLWNAARFLQMNLNGSKIVDNIDATKLSTVDLWMISKLNRTIKEVNMNIEKYEFGISLQKICSLFWDSFCDWYLEFCKNNLGNNNYQIQTSCFIFSQILKIFHPFAPFVTEKIWSIFFDIPLITSSFPVYESRFDNNHEEHEIEMLISCIHSIRAKRNEMDTPHNRKIKIYVDSKNIEFFEKNSEEIKRLSNVSEINTYVNNSDSDNDRVFIALDFAKICIPINDLVDIEKLKIKTKNEIDKLKNQIKKNENLILNKDFLSKAPSNVVDNVKKALESDKARLQRLLENSL